MASAKLANSTVNQSQSVICTREADAAAPVNRSRIRNTVVSAAPDLHHEHHRVLRISVAGFSLPNESTMARRTIGGSNSGRARASFLRQQGRRICSGAVAECGAVVRVDIV